MNIRKKNLLTKTSKWFVFALIVFSLQSCYHYRVLNTVNDPASVQYHEKVMWSYCWGLVNKPGNFTVPDCTNSSIDEVRISSNLATSLLTVITLGFVSPVKVEWKCHKPCQKIGEM